MTTRKLAMVVALVWIAVAGALLAFMLPSVLDDVTLRKEVTITHEVAETEAVTETETGKTLTVTLAPDEIDNASCFCRKGVAAFCAEGWEDPNGEWYIDTDSEDNVVVYDHRDRSLGYVRENAGGDGWRAVVFTCPDNPPKAWAKQGCGYVRDGTLVEASKNVWYVFKRGKRIGIARGPNAFGVAVLKLVMEW
jgi:hypothetical protein